MPRLIRVPWPIADAPAPIPVTSNVHALPTSLTGCEEAQAQRLFDGK